MHNVTAETAIKELQSDIVKGLDSQGVQQKRQKFGFNELTTKKRVPLWILFLKQFHQSLIYILLTASLVSFFLGEVVDGAVIFAVVFINAIIGLIQESKAEKAIEALSLLIKMETTVRRDGEKKRIPAIELVPGDIVIIGAGDRVPADMRLFRTKNLQVDEAPLTGESLPVIKNTAPLPPETPLSDRKNMLYASTLVMTGIGEALVTAIGNKTETGRVAGMIDEASNFETPLTIKLRQFSNFLLIVILALSVITFVIGILRGEEINQMFMAAVALAVGAIPEGLPAAVTITLAIGVTRMARRHAIIRKLAAVETLGSTTVICSDKTGTITENKMTVTMAFAGGNQYRLSGTGYSLKGEITRGDKNISVENDSALKQCLLAGLCCQDTQIVEKDGRLQVEGDPTEAALITAAKKAGIRETPSRYDTFPFDSEHMFMATLHENPSQNVIFKKGSLEAITSTCQFTLMNDSRLMPFDEESTKHAAKAMASQGMRVLAMAQKKVHKDQRHISMDNLTHGFTFLGLQGMIDPPRQEVIEAVKRCQEAGINVKMITGDHADTASAIAFQLGLSKNAQGNKAIVGHEFAKKTEDELSLVVENTAVFARVLPEQKLKLVRALQKKGHIVAMTGDGINDSPALRQANIGVAMGITGTDVAKGAADMILTDDNFASIEAAVEEGRNVFDNLTKFIAWTLPTNGGEALTLITAIFLGTTLPILPVHLLWINMLSAVFLGTTLVLEPKEKGLMQRKPRNLNEPILTRGLMGRTLAVSVMIAVGCFLLFYFELNEKAASVTEARTAVVNVIVVALAFYLLNCRSIRKSFFTLPFFSNPWIWVGIILTLCAQLAFTYLPLMNTLFHTAPISQDAWVRILGVGLAIFMMIELSKLLVKPPVRGRQKS